MTDLTNPEEGSVTSVTGTWYVPEISPSPIHTFSSFWVGIDGYTSPTVEQIGTEHDWSSHKGKQINYAWFEMYPKNAFVIKGFPLEIGDKMSAQVSYVGDNEFNLTIINSPKAYISLFPQNIHTQKELKGILRNGL